MYAASSVIRARIFVLAGQHLEHSIPSIGTTMSQELYHKKPTGGNQSLLLRAKRLTFGIDCWITYTRQCINKIKMELPW